MRFETARLATDAGLLKRFVFLFGAARVVPEFGPCHFHELLRGSETVGSELTNKFYSKCANIRQNVFAHLRQDNPATDPKEILRCTQKLLDRVLFCAFCEDRNLLPAQTVARAFTHSDPYNPKPVWENFRGLFRSVDKGNAGLKIPAYNGGLFAHDEALDSLLVPDEVCRYFRDLGDYDFRPARAVADAQKAGLPHPRQQRPRRLRSLRRAARQRRETELGSRFISLKSLTAPVVDRPSDLTPQSDPLGPSGSAAPPPF